MVLLLIRLFIAPIVVLGATFVQRRFGHAVSGLLIGLPLTSLPLLFLVDLQSGSHFAASMSSVILASAGAQVFVIWLYSRLATRLSAMRTLLCTLGAFVVVTVPFMITDLTALAASVVAVGVVLVALQAWPRVLGEVASTGSYRLWLRVVLAAGFTVAIVTLSGRMGPGLSGVAGALPVMSLTIAFVTHRELGATATVRFLEGTTKGTFAFVASLFVLTELLRSGRVALAFLFAVVVALAVQYAVHLIDSRQLPKALFGAVSIRAKASYERLASPVAQRFISLRRTGASDAITNS